MTREEIILDAEFSDKEYKIEGKLRGKILRAMRTFAKEFLPPAKSAKEFIKNIYGDNKADWESNQCDIRFNLSDIAQLCQEFAATQNNSLPSAECAGTKCSYCNGDGQVVQDYEHGEISKCTICNGTGKIHKHQPTAEGAEEILSPQDFFNKISTHPLGVQARLKHLKMFNVVCSVMKKYVEFAALNAGKMVEEKLREELILYHFNLYPDTGQADAEHYVNEYLKSRE